MLIATIVRHQPAWAVKTKRQDGTPRALQDHDAAARKELQYFVNTGAVVRDVYVESVEAAVIIIFPHKVQLGIRVPMR